MLRTCAAAVVAAAGLAVAGWQVAPAFTDPHLPALLAGPSVGWVLVAQLLAAGALAAYGELHRQLLVQAGHPMPAWIVQAVTVAGNAVSLTIPAVGTAAGPAYAVRALHVRGVEMVAATWSVGMASVVTTVLLVVLAPLGLAAGGVLDGRIAVGLAASGAVVAAGLWTATRRHFRRDSSGPSTGLLAALGRYAGWVAHHAPRPSQWVLLLATALTTWLLDLLALAASVAALGGPVPWGGVVLGYLAVQASIAVRLTPGGAGGAEAGLLAALVAAGMAGPSAALAVALYRCVSWLVPAAVGWLIVLALLVRRRVEFEGGSHRSEHEPTQ